MIRIMNASTHDACVRRVATGVLAGLAIFACPDPSFAYVVGGTPAAACAWPSVVQVGECSGVLVHPWVVLTSWTCREATSVTFGASSSGPFDVAADCRDLPSSRQIGYCMLERAVDEVPVIPVVQGCEAELLEEFQGEIAVGVGYGTDRGRCRRCGYEACRRHGNRQSARIERKDRRWFYGVDLLQGRRRWPLVHRNDQCRW